MTHPSSPPTRRGLRQWIHANAWPIGIVTVVACFVGVDGMLITVAVRQRGAIAPESDYYDKAVHFDDEKAVSARTEQAGLAAAIQVASVPLVGMPRLVNVLVTGRDGLPVSGLRGTLTAVRPADARLSNSGELVAVPDQPGAYRLLLKLPAAGLWEFQMNAKDQGGESYRLVVRKDVAL